METVLERSCISTGLMGFINTCENTIASGANNDYNMLHAFYAGTLDQKQQKHQTSKSVHHLQHCCNIQALITYITYVAVMADAI